MHSDEADAIWVGEQGEECSGRLRLARTLALKPVAGDWIALKGERVTKVFPRRNELRRTQTHGRPAQVLAANVDVVFVVVPLHSELHQRMVEGLLAMAIEAGVEPVLVITKIDEGDDENALASLQARMVDLIGNVRQVTTSAHTGAGIEDLRELLGAGVAPDFSDIEELALSCEFTNCGHGTDRGCAVTAAVAGGTVSPERLALWRQLGSSGPSY